MRARVWRPLESGVRADLLALYVSDIRSAKRQPGIDLQPSYFALTAGAEGTLLFCEDIAVRACVRVCVCVCV